MAAASRLFSEKGYDGTGIEEISRLSGTNKALIYYHFQNKEGLLLALYGRIMEEVSPLVGSSAAGGANRDREAVVRGVRRIIAFLREKKPLLKILMMESLKGGRSQEVFMELAESLMQGELDQLKGHGDYHRDRPRFLIYEFFTGFMVLYNFILFGSPLADRLGLDEKAGEDLFIDGFIRSHLGHHNF